MSTPGHELQPVVTQYLQPRNKGFNTDSSKKLTTRERINNVMEEATLESAPAMARQALDVFRQSMNSKDQNVRLKAAKDYLKHGYQPTQQVDVNVTDATSLTPEQRGAIDHISPEELEYLDQVQGMFNRHREASIIEAEVVGEEISERPSDG